jgi:hypothetical protein
MRIVIRILGVVLTVCALVVVATRGYAQTKPEGDAWHRAVRNMHDCFKEEYSPSQYTSSDGGHSSLLLAKCGDQWDAASKQCQLDTHDTPENCNEKTGMLAQAYIILREGGAQ